MIKLIAIDLDGTLLDSQKEIPQANIEAIRKAAQAGVKIVLCTGRPRSGVLPYLKELDLADDEYVILNNGTAIYNTKNWDLVDYDSLDFEEMAYLQELCRDEPGIDLTLTAEKTFYVVGSHVPDIVAYDAGLVFDQAKAASLDAIATGDQMIFQAMYMGDEQAIDAFQAKYEEKLSQQFSTVRSQSYIFEAMPKGRTKATGLQSLAKELGLSADHIMAIGDAANDLEMLDFVTHSVAMGNASDEVKSLCRYITTSNDQAGVAKAIEKYVLK